MLMNSEEKLRRQRRINKETLKAARAAADDAKKREDRFALDPVNFRGFTWNKDAIRHSAERLRFFLVAVVLFFLASLVIGWLIGMLMH